MSVYSKDEKVCIVSQTIQTSRSDGIDETKFLSLLIAVKIICILVCSGKPMFTCLRNFCQWSTCPAHPDAKCRVNPCGGCKVEFVDKSGKVVNCVDGKLSFSQFESVLQSGLIPVSLLVTIQDVYMEF